MPPTAPASPTSPATLHRRVRAACAVVLAALLLAVGGAGRAAAAPTPVPCTAAGGGHFNCSWRVPGNGTSGGSPVLDGAGARVGFLHQGVNFVVCQQTGRRETDGKYFNDTWAFTEADDRRTGWVNAVWASGGDNDGPFRGVPGCGGRHGNPPGARASAPRPAPKPAPAKPAPAPTAGAGQVPCSAEKGNKAHHDCGWRVAGNGRSAGSPVLDSNGGRVGFLHQGTNWISCQAIGRSERDGSVVNDVWGRTIADNGKAGWVSAIWAKGGANDGGFRGVPRCSSGHPPQTPHPTSPSTPAPVTPAPTPTPTRGASQVPCKAGAKGHHDCRWRVPGNGRTGGAPVLDAMGRRVGYLAQGTNWILCQATGRTERAGTLFNDVWGYTTADDGKKGWVSALWAVGGANDGGFSGTPACGARYGSPPTSGSSSAPPAPKPPATPGPSRPIAKRDCSDSRTNEFRTVHFAFHQTHNASAQSGNPAAAPVVKRLPGDGDHEYGTVIIGGSTCKVHGKRWEINPPLSITQNSKGIYRDTDDKAHPGGHGVTQGWGVAVSGGSPNVLNVQSSVCHDTTKGGALNRALNDGVNALSVPIPKPFYWAVIQFVATNAAHKVIDRFTSPPVAAVRCANLGQNQLKVSVDGSGHLVVRAYGVTTGLHDQTSTKINGANVTTTLSDDPLAPRVVRGRG